MSNNVLILDAGCQNFGKGGELNHYLSRLAEGELTKLGWNVEMTHCPPANGKSLLKRKRLRKPMSSLSRHRAGG